MVADKNVTKYVYILMRVYNYEQKTKVISMATDYWFVESFQKHMNRYDAILIRTNFQY